jgi:hypothetical protein
MKKARDVLEALQCLLHRFNVIYMFLQRIKKFLFLYATEAALSFAAFNAFN